MTAAPPTLLGDRYRVIRPLGEGTYGAVYEAENTWTGRRVAVKVLVAEASRDGEVTRRFFQEARAAAGVAHPNVVDVLDMGEDPRTGALFIVQSLLAGETLQAAIRRRGALPPEEAAAIVGPMLEGLDAIHRAGLVHRDVKPANVLLVEGPGGRVAPTLIDFGVAKFVASEDAAARTATGVLLGTPLYMSPEQVRAEPDVDARADVWAAGVILHELLAGKSPFHASTAGEVLRRVLEHRPPSLAAPVPAALAAVAARAMEPDRRRRFPSARAMADALTAATRGEATAPTLDAKPARQSVVRTAGRWPLVAGALGALALGWLLGRATRPAPTYAVSLRADAPGAEIELDGRVVGRDAWRATFARDGAAHVVKVRAEGRGERVIRFRDAAPPERVALPSAP